MKIKRIFDIFRPVWRWRSEDAAFYVASTTNDQKILEKIARQSSVALARTVACEKIMDQEVLFMVAMYEQDVYVGEEALKGIADAERLLRLAFRAENQRISFQALERALKAKKQLPNDLWLKTDFIETASKSPFNPIDFSLMAIFYEDQYTGLCEAVIKALERRLYWPKQLADYQLEMSAQDALKSFVAPFLQERMNAETKASIPKHPNMEKLKAFLNSEYAIWAYIVLAGIIYGIYCYFADVPNFIRRQEPITTMELVVLMALALPLLIAMIVKYRKRS